MMAHRRPVRQIDGEPQSEGGAARPAGLVDQRHMKSSACDERRLVEPIRQGIVVRVLGVVRLEREHHLVEGRQRPPDMLANAEHEVGGILAGLRQRPLALLPDVTQNAEPGKSHEDESRQQDRCGKTTAAEAVQWKHCGQRFRCGTEIEPKDKNLNSFQTFPNIWPYLLTSQSNLEFR
jgi:hypothetical protein